MSLSEYKEKTHIVDTSNTQGDKLMALCGREIRWTSPHYTLLQTWAPDVHTWICKNCMKKVDKE